MSVGRKAGETTAALGAQLAGRERGTCVSIDWPSGLVTVNIGGGQQAMPMAGLAPAVGDQVWVAYLAGEPLCIGPLAKSAQGTITSGPNAGKVGVRGDDGGVYSLPFNFDHAAFATGQRVAIDWQSGSVAYRLSSDSTIVAPVTPPPVAAQRQTREFVPTGSGSFYSSSGTWTKNDVWCSDTLLGCYFYGTQIADTIPDTATIVSVTLNVTETTNRFPSALATIGTHGLTGRTGAPTIANAVPVPNGSGSKSLPTAFGDRLKTGEQLGLGTNHGGLHVYAVAPDSGRLIITYDL